MNDIIELQRQGLSQTKIQQLTGYDRKTIRKYLQHPQTPRYGPRRSPTSRTRLISAYLPYLQQRLTAGVWNAVVLFAEIKAQGYSGSYTAVKDFVRPKRKEALAVAVRRFETPPGRQAQVDWGELGDITLADGTKKTLSGFVLTLGHSRAMFCDIATDQKLETLLRMHEAAFAALGGVPQEILYDRMKTVVLGQDERGETKWHPTFADFASYWGFTPRLCRAYRPQTKGKVENGIGYVKKSFLCGRTASSLDDLRSQMRVWQAEVANLRVHGTTHRIVAEVWQEEQSHLQPAASRLAYPLVIEAVRQVSRDAFVSYRANRYSVPWQNAGKEVIVREKSDQLEILREGQVLAVHLLCRGRFQQVSVSSHHADIPLGTKRAGKPRLSLKVTAPEVEVRSLAVYEALAMREGAA